MNRLLTILFIWAWTLWLGGLTFLFFAVTALFGHDHALAAESAPVVFACFEKYQLTLALVSVILSGVLIGMEGRWRWRRIWLCMAGGCVAALITSQYLTPRINALHLAGLAHTPEFRRLHGWSFGVYLIEMLMLLAVGAMLPRALRGANKPRSSAIEDAVI